LPPETAMGAMPAADPNAVVAANDAMKTADAVRAKEKLRRIKASKLGNVA
jgi:hypothetical protein